MNHQKFRINWLRDVGLLNYWERRNWPMENKCSEPLAQGAPADETKLTMDNLSSSFILLIFGMSLSFLVYLIEWMHLIYIMHNRRIITV